MIKIERWCRQKYKYKVIYKVSVCEYIFQYRQNLWRHYGQFFFIFGILIYIFGFRDKKGNVYCNNSLYAGPIEYENRDCHKWFFLWCAVNIFVAKFNWIKSNEKSAWNQRSTFVTYALGWTSVTRIFWMKHLNSPAIYCNILTCYNKNNKHH